MNHCDLVHDLLPLYIEDLTSEGSADFVREHLNTCPQCRKEYDRISQPEPVPIKPREEWKSALKKVRIKNILKSSLLWTVVVLLLISLWAGYRLYDHSRRFTVTENVITVLEPEEILSICPRAVPTAEELRFLEEYRPGAGRDLTQDILTKEEYGVFKAYLVPEDARIGEIIESKILVCVDYFHQGQRILLTYTDTNQDGTLDELNKLISAHPGETDQPFYSATYSTQTRTTVYERYESS